MPKLIKMAKSKKTPKHPVKGEPGYNGSYAPAFSDERRAWCLETYQESFQNDLDAMARGEWDSFTAGGTNQEVKAYYSVFKNWYYKHNGAWGLVELEMDEYFGNAPIPYKEGVLNTS